jgi:hypothetical protein
MVIETKKGAAWPPSCTYHRSPSKIALTGSFP